MINWKLEYTKWLEKLSNYDIFYSQLKNMQEDEKTLEDAFYRELSFGTSGLRGIMGLGTNRMNDFVVAKATKGVAQYLNNILKDKKERKVVISYDSRHHSKEFAMIVARVLVNEGIKVYLFKELTAVPILTFAIKKLSCSLGIMITASHNNKIYNGYKVYNEYGYQILEDESKAILNEIEKIDIFDENLLKIVTGGDEGQENIIYIDEEIENTYIKELYEELKHLGGNLENISIIYSNLNGTGRRPIAKLFEKFQIKELRRVEAQWEYDGDFTTCPNPNPEYFEAYEQARKVAEESGIKDMILTDPDCDRIGYMRADRLFSGNQIASLMSWYMREQFKNSNRLSELKDYVVIRSVVSSPIVEKMLQNYAVESENTLIGFKYMGQKAHELSSHGKKVFIAFEEGNGFLMTQKIRDKDGISSALILAKALAYLKEKNLTLEEVFDSIYKECGYHREETLSYTFTGSEGERKMDSLLEKIRENSFDFFEEFDVLFERDYLHKTEKTVKGSVQKWDNKLPISNIIELEGKSFKLLFRRSGTEPKLKAYIICFDKNKKACEKLLDDIKMKVNKVVKEYRLDEE